MITFLSTVFWVLGLAGLYSTRWDKRESVKGLFTLYLVIVIISTWTLGIQAGR